MATAMVAPDKVELNYVTSLPKDQFVTEIERPNYYSSIAKDRLALFFNRAVQVDSQAAEAGTRIVYAVPHGWVEIGPSGTPFRNFSGHGMSDEHVALVRDALWRAGVRADWIGVCGSVAILSVYEGMGY